MSETNSKNSIFSNISLVHIAAEIVVGLGIVYFFINKNNTLTKYININQRKILELEAKINQQDQMLRYVLNSMEQQKAVIDKLVNQSRNPIIEVSNTTPVKNVQNEMKQSVNIQQKFETESNLDKELENELNELDNEEQLSISGQDISEGNSEEENSEEGNDEEGNDEEGNDEEGNDQ